MNWGWKIAILYSGFVVMTLGMVFYFMGHKVDLVAEDYYKQEIAYQDQIDKMSNSQAMLQPLGIDLDRQTLSAIIRFPTEHASAGIQGSVQLYRPANSDEDKSFDILIDSTGVQSVLLTGFSKGLWKIKVMWNSGGKDYYSEKVVTL
ncbi:MAG: FixH family protein [Cyclobacteriaceae bacterium]|nr:FixH family protein [Cyclobacteriaceae bacterium]